MRFFFATARLRGHSASSVAGLRQNSAGEGSLREFRREAATETPEWQLTLRDLSQASFSDEKVNRGPSSFARCLDNTSTKAKGPRFIFSTENRRSPRQLDHAVDHRELEVACFLDRAVVDGPPRARGNLLPRPRGGHALTRRARRTTGDGELSPSGPLCLDGEPPFRMETS